MSSFFKNVIPAQAGIWMKIFHLDENIALDSQDKTKAYSQLD